MGVFIEYPADFRLSVTVFQRGIVAPISTLVVALWYLPSGMVKYSQLLDFSFLLKVTYE
jgi:hypothetical protein